MFVGNPYNPYWWGPGPALSPTPNIRRVDIGGIFELSTNAVQLTDASVDYGINPVCYNALPCESIVLLKIHSDVPAGGEALPVTIVVPNGGNTTLATAGSTTGSTKVPVVDSNNNNVTGGDITGTTERLAYINKRTGVIRFLEFTAGSATSGGGAANGEANTPAAAAEKGK